MRYVNLWFYRHTELLYRKIVFSVKCSQISDYFIGNFSKQMHVTKLHAPGLVSAGTIHSDC